MTKRRIKGEYKVPEGLYYYPDFISKEEENALLNFISTLEFSKVVIFEQEAKRTVAHCGYKYHFETATLSTGELFPTIIQELSSKCADLAKIPQTKTAPIGWHRYKLMFGPQVIGVSLLSSCVMRFQLKEHNKRYVYEQDLAPCSVYILSGKAQFNWEHSIPPIKEELYSITFRTLK